jgi:indole-3-glycerol phosphate synthase
MAATYLDAILAYHRERAALDTRDWLARVAGERHVVPSLRAALAGPGDVRVIAEVKRRSPSKGWLAAALDPADLARAYAAGGASAISVLTDEPHFAGAPEHLAAVRAAVTLPVLRKDFTVAPNDVVDAAEMGASAVLLIAAALDDRELADLANVARACGLETLVEVHDEAEAARALNVGADVIGVNQRDLHSFAVDAARAARVIAALPPDVVTVAESGLASASDVERAAAAGFDAVLVGEAFVTSPDPAATVRAFASVPKVRRG